MSIASSTHHPIADPIEFLAAWLVDPPSPSACIVEDEQANDDRPTLRQPAQPHMPSNDDSSSGVAMYGALPGPILSSSCGDDPSTSYAPCDPADPALHARLNGPSLEVAELQALLHASEQQLASMIEGAPFPKYDGAKQYATAVDRMRQTVEQLRAAIAQRATLRQQNTLLQQQLALVEREERLLLRHGGLLAPRRRGGVAAAPLPRPWVLPPANGQYPPSSGCIVSVHQLPRGADWDAAWTARLLDMRVLDVLLLRRQWLYFSAVKLPLLQTLRDKPAGQAAEAEIRALYDRFADFTHRLLQVQPELWHESYNYDMDSLQPLAQAPTREHLRPYYQGIPGSVEKLRPIHVHFHRIIPGLRAEEAALRRAYAQLDGDALSSRSCLGGSTRAQACVEADKVLAKIEANLRQQKLQVANFVHAANYALPLEEAVKLKLMLYPLVVGGQLSVQQMYAAPLPEPQQQQQ